MNLPHVSDRDKKLLIKVIAGVILFVIAFISYCMKDTGTENDMVITGMPGNEVPKEEQTTTPAITENIMIFVDIAGAVASPSVIELPEGSRVFEAIEQAGGLTKDADTRCTNLAEVLTDGQKLYIPTKKELEDNPAGPSGIIDSNTGTSHTALININTADSSTLQQLSGVGPATAEKIISYRNENGKFKAIEDIKNVSGIGDKTFEKFKNKITI